MQAHDGWMPLISISGLDDLYLEHFDHANEADVTGFLVSDKRNPGSLVNAAIAVRDNLRSSRDIFPRQMYEKISTLVRYIRGGIDIGVSTRNRHTFLDSVERQLLEIAGAVHNSLRQDQAYTFMRIASYIERADMTSRVLDVPASVVVSSASESGYIAELSALENRHWTGALNSVSAMQMYRRHVRQPVSAEGCLRFLLNDEYLPGACRFCLVRLDRRLEYLKYNEAPRAAVALLLSKLTHADVPMLAVDSAARHEFLDQIQLGLLVTGDAIAKSYFSSAKNCV